MGLRDYGAGPRPTTTITFRGRDLVVRDLTSPEAQRLDALFPPPSPPLGPDPRRGGGASPVLRVDDPRFVAQRREHAVKVRPAEVAIATEWADGQGRTFALTPPDQQLAWCQEARAWCENHLSDSELSTLHRALQDLADGPGGRQEAPGKGSSDGSSPAPPPASA